MAQDAVQKAEEQVMRAQKELDVGKIAFTKRWCSNNPGVPEADLLSYLTSYDWKEHPTRMEADLLEYLNQNLARLSGGILRLLCQTGYEPVASR